MGQEPHSEFGRIFAPPIVVALAALLRLRGQPVSCSRLMAALPGGMHTPTVEECLTSAREAGVETRLLAKSRLGDIPAPTLPCLLLTQPMSDGQTGACVLVGLDEESEQADIMFPETEPEIRRVAYAQVYASYTGLAVFAVQKPRSDPRTEKIQLLKDRHWFWGVLRDYLPLYRDVALASLVVNLLTLASPLFIMNVYDRVVPNNALYTLWTLVGGLMLAHLMDFALRNLRGRFVDLAGRNTDVIIGSRLMHKVLHMRMDSKPDSTGALINNLREFEQVRDFFGSTTLLALFDLPFLLLFVLIVAMIGGPMVGLVLVALPLMVGFVACVQIPFQRSVERQFKQNMSKNAMLVEITGGLETVKSIRAEGRMQRRWEDVVDASAEESARGRGLSSLAASGTLFITYLINAGVVVWGVYRISAGLMTQGGLIACVIMVSRSLGPLMQLATMITQMQRARMAMKGLALIMDLPSEDDTPSQAPGEDLKPELQLDTVTFRYPNSPRPALRDVSLIIRPGERVGFVGPTGSGKSTLARLLMGLYQPSEGSVLFGGVDIRQIDQADLRGRIGFMPQDNYLFFGSVRENIAMGAPWLTMEDLVRAAEITGVAEFVMNHPQGYDLPVGERGLALSGGQRQAVALARTLAGKPDVLILDEPSSNLDMEAEHRLMLRLQTIVQGRTLLIMTHRPSLLALAERVVLLDEGRIVAQGARDAMLKAMREGKFRLGSGHVRT